MRASSVASFFMGRLDHTRESFSVVYHSILEILFGPAWAGSRRKQGIAERVKYFLPQNKINVRLKEVSRVFLCNVSDRVQSFHEQQRLRLH